MASQNTPYIALRLAYADPATGRVRAQHGDSSVFLASDALLSDAGISSVTAYERDGGLLLRVRCHPAACQRLAAATGANTGRSLAVVIGSRVFGVAPIMAGIGNGDSLTIATEATGADAERIAREIRARWSPARDQRP